MGSKFVFLNMQRKVFTRMYNISTPLMMEKPVRSPIVPPIADSMSTYFAALSLKGLERLTNFSCFYFTFSSLGVILWKWVLNYKNFCKIVSNTTFKLFGLAEEILSVRNISLLLYLVVLSMRNSYVRKLKIDILSTMSNPKLVLTSIMLSPV